MGVCDYRYRFVLVDVGAPGRQSDGGVFRDSIMGQRFENGTMNLPRPNEIYPDGPVLPYFLVGDEAFGLKSYIQRPFPGRSTGNLSIPKKIFNYRLSRARRVIENTFGIMAAKWRIFRKPIEAKVEKVDQIVKAAICLHNFILIEEEHLKPSQKSYITPTMADYEVDGLVVNGDWRSNDTQHGWGNISKQGSNNQTGEQAKVRNTLMDHFMNEGSVPWQWNRNIF